MAYVVGLMNGTSVDGCDAALVNIENGSTELLSFITLPTPPALKRRILDCCSLDMSDIRLVCSLNFEIGQFFAEAAKEVCRKAGVRTEDLFCIGSHGQTVDHIPVAGEGAVRSTLQLGEPAVIAWETGAPVVSSFRAMDMAAGGNGAPLVPYTEYLLYRGETASALQNLGGIGNVTVLPANCTLSEVFAFDTGPANMIIDALTQRFFGKQYDEGGEIAFRGCVNGELIKEWMDMPYIKQTPPKATGRELFGEQFVSCAVSAHPWISPEDFVATATAFTAASMGYAYRNFVFPKCIPEKVILAGGGSHNNALVKMIKDELTECRVLTQEDIGYSSDAKEAIAFALLAYETMNGRTGNAPAATGAGCRVILGNITPRPVRL